jgi:polyisoprenoid-binding protein YceI
MQKIDPSGTWTVDPIHTVIGFSVTHLGVSKTRGKFNEFTGEARVDAKNPAKSFVNFTIQAASIDTGMKARDEHLRNADFFDVAKYPTITFQSTKIEKRGRSYQATGKLTMHGVTKVISFPFTITGPARGMQKEVRGGMEARLKLNRKDYGLTWNRLVEGSQAVGDIVSVEIDLEATKK